MSYLKFWRRRRSPFRPLCSTFFLAALLNVSFAPSSTAQQVRTCDELIQESDGMYRDGQFDRAVQLVNECLEKGDLSREDLVASYRLMALAYIRMDELGDARMAVLHLLNAAPEYVPDPIADPPDYTVLVEIVKREFQPPAEPTVERRSWFVANAAWLVSGGLAVAGGILAAVLLPKQGSPEGPTLPPPPGMPN